MLTGEQERVLDCLCELLEANITEVIAYTRLPRDVAYGVADWCVAQGYLTSEKRNKWTVYRITEKGRRAATTYNPQVWTA